jgi:hypothetical protein
VEHGGPQVRLRLWLQVHVDRLEAQFRDTGRRVDLVRGPEPSPELAEDGRGSEAPPVPRSTPRHLPAQSAHTNRVCVTKRRTPVG